METIYLIIEEIIKESWDILQESSIYVLIGILVGGGLQMFLSTEAVARHLGKGRFISVFKAALFGIPLPLCSCGVLPAAASLKRQGANNGATMAFLISTPESGVDSITVTYALLDPIMTVVRPLAAFITAFTAGVAENMIKPPAHAPFLHVMTPGSVASCHEGNGCCGTGQESRGTFWDKMRGGIRYAVGDLWGDLAGWFFLGILLAGIVSAIIPDDLLAEALGGGLFSMLIMLAAGIPLYICATASTPIAAALIMKGVSPGAALVFLLAGPATNVTSLSVLTGLLGKRATLVYLAAIVIMSVLCGFALDGIYAFLGIDAGATVGQAGDVLPEWLQTSAAIVLFALTVKPLMRKFMK